MDKQKDFIELTHESCRKRLDIKILRNTGRLRVIDVR